MGLADFWDNVTTPGFLAQAVQELCDLWRDIKQEAGELWQEGEELFTDGFLEMVVKDNNDYKTSAEKRKKAEGILAEASEEVLAARGVNRDWQGRLRAVTNAARETAKALDDLDGALLDGVIAGLRETYTALEVRTPAKLRAFAHRAEKILDLPGTPAFVHPAPADPGSPPATDRRRRVAAADHFLAEVEDFAVRLKDEAESQRAAGPLFAPGRIGADLEDALQVYCCRIEDRRLALAFLPCIEEEESLALTVRAAVLSISAACSILSLAFLEAGEEKDVSALSAELLAGLGEEE